jgi:predicted nuclease of restriction endonuclease-like (RecB) superfamily
MNTEYIEILNLLKDKIKYARQKTALAVNLELLKIYWEIGQTILIQEQKSTWGTKIIDNLSNDLRIEFSDMKGLSSRNLRYMRDFAQAFPQFLILQDPVAKTQTIDNQSDIILQQSVAKLPWGHICSLLDKVKSNEDRLFYITKTIDNGWSREILKQQIDTQLHYRLGGSINNFRNTLPETQSDLAEQTLKNPYVFDFLSFTEKMKEKDLELGLIEHLKKFLLELGKGFAFVGNQNNLNINGNDYYLDLLFYNYAMHCFVVFELKIGDFKPEYAGKLNFYVNAIDSQFKSEKDGKTIGVLLCKTPNDTIIKYSLNGIESPIGVADYRLGESLPNQISTNMPSIEELEAELDKEYEELKSPSQKRFDILKEKLTTLKGEEIKQLATFKIYCEIIDNGLVPLFNNIIESFKVFNELFISFNKKWRGQNKLVSDINEFYKAFKNEDYFKTNNEINFEYSLFGLKKGGVENINAWISLKCTFEEYCYSFSIVNLNNQIPFIKKLYHEKLNSSDIETIKENVFEFVLSQIETQVERLNKIS